MILLEIVCKYKRAQLIHSSFQTQNTYIFVFPFGFRFSCWDEWQKDREVLWRWPPLCEQGESLLQRRTNCGSKTSLSVMVRCFLLPFFLELFSQDDVTSGKTHKLSQVKNVLSVMLAISDLSLFILTHEPFLHFISLPTSPPSFWGGEWLSWWVPKPKKKPKPYKQTNKKIPKKPQKSLWLNLEIHQLQAFLRDIYACDPSCIWIYL